MIICKECRCFNPVTVSDRYCGECCIGDTRNPIAINADITGCCLFEPKKQKSLTNADRIRQMEDEELAKKLRCDSCLYQVMKSECESSDCVQGILAWLRKEVSEDAAD